MSETATTDRVLQAVIKSIGDGRGEGKLLGHPAPSTLVRTRLASPFDLHVTLWDGPVFVGEGVLRLVGEQWSGEVGEYAGRWWVSSRKGSGVLEFRDRPPPAADPEDARVVDAMYRQAVIDGDAVE